MSTPLELSRKEEASAAWPSELDASDIDMLLSMLTKSLRAHQLYEPNNPVYQRFMGAIDSAFTALWRHTSVLRLTIEEDRFRWEGEGITGDDARKALAFLFYKDGIRTITFLPGFEEEAERFLGVLRHARQLDHEGDDLVTLLWEQEFASFQYDYVDVLSEGLELPSDEAEDLGPIAPERIAEEVGDAGPTAESPEAEPGTAAAPASETAISREDFQETLYFLDEAELRQLRDEVAHEWNRDLRPPLLNALFDRLEDENPERQAEILEILRQLLPVLLGRGELQAAVMMLRELDALVESGDMLGEAVSAEVERVFDELSDPVVLSQFIESLEHGDVDPEAEELALFLARLRPSALPVLVRAARVMEAGSLRERLESAVDRLAGEYPDVVIELLGSDDAAVAVGAVRVAGRLRLTEAAGALTRLFERADARVRREVIGALVALRSAAAIEVLQRGLDDGDRDVRIAAARGLRDLRYQPARERLEAVVDSRQIRNADLSEQLAFFEAFAAVAGGEGVALLGRLLNDRKLLRGYEPVEIRACAARALGRIGSPAARAALERAADEEEPMVRNAVSSALRAGGAGS